MTAAVAVTGAGGFIGSAIVRAFRQRGFDVRAHLGPPGQRFDPPPTGTMTSAFAIEDRTALQRFLAGCDTVVHAAGPPSVRASFEDPVSFVRTHAVGAATVIDAMRQGTAQRLVLISSAEVYGRPGRDNVIEDDRLEPRSPYGAAKLAAESVVRGTARSFEIAACMLRPFSVYGPGMSTHSLIGSIVDQAMYSKTIVVDDASAVRDYCYVEDVAEAAVLAALNEAPDITVYNIGSGVPTDVRLLVATVGQVLGNALALCERGAARPASAEISRLIADTTAARTVLRWQPRYSLAEGLRRTIAAQGPS